MTAPWKNRPFSDDPEKQREWDEACAELDKALQQAIEGAPELFGLEAE